MSHLKLYTEVDKYHFSQQHKTYKCVIKKKKKLSEHLKTIIHLKVWGYLLYE